MKTSLFDVTFTLPPLMEMTEVEKDMYVMWLELDVTGYSCGLCHPDSYC
jgi:hypothetical protein|tara:strand:+ start:100 stop:246 length:147 start_codon:yes stop_codon:yes gene_type:complete